jgi:lysozyme
MKKMKKTLIKKQIRRKITMMKTGIDISAYQGDIDFREVSRSGIDFVIIKSNYGANTADNFEKNYAGAKAAGLDCGAYLYSYALTESEAVLEAKACIQTLKGKKFEYPVFFDIEENKQFNLGKSKCSAIVKAFCETMEDAGYFVGIYSSKSHLENFISEDLRKRYCVWVAHYGVEQTSYGGPYDIHQYSDKGRVSGINTAVDMNHCFADYKVIKEKGFNGFRPDGAVPEESKVRSTLKTVQKGSDGDFVTLAQNLLKIHGHDIGKSGADGKFGENTEKAAKEFQKKKNLTSDGIIGPETWAELLKL